MHANLLTVVAAVLIAAGCAAPEPAPAGWAPTPGCPNVAWDSYKGLTDLPGPSGLTITSTSRTGVTVKNATTTPWTVRVEWWSNQMCFGWTASEGPYATVAAGAAQDLTAPDNGAGGLETRIGVVFWDHAPDQASPGQANGFGWVEVPQPSASN